MGVDRFLVYTLENCMGKNRVHRLRILWVNTLSVQYCVLSIACACVHVCVCVCACMHVLCSRETWFV